MFTNAEVKSKRPGINNLIIPILLFIPFFVLNSVLGYYAMRDIALSQLEVNQSLGNINFINELYVEILKAETGQRGYLLTDLENYLTPFIGANAVIDQKIQELRSAPLDSTQRINVGELIVLVEEKIIELGDTITAVRENSNANAIVSLFSGRNRNLLQEISDKVTQMENYERNLLSDRLGEASRSRGTALILILAANLVGVLLVVLSLGLVIRGIRKDRDFSIALQESHEQLEVKVEERTEALEHLSRELKRSNRELQDFAFVASHDLQEPLRKIRAFGDRLQSNFGDKLGEQGGDYIERMRNASRRMSNLINDLLTFSRITTKAESFKPVDLQQVLDEVLDDLEILIEESKASVHCDGLPVIEADYSQMKQLLQNLISNAIKFRRADVLPVVDITTRMVEQNAEGLEFLEMQVSDNGIGFDEKYLDRIFQPFQRLHGKGEFAGTGIGLSVCRRIVERHGGSLTAHSKIGGGSSFIVLLPLVNKQYDLAEEIQL
ncbi:MAG: ATP-binding protein [Gammaproteobacteria bacterium]